MSITLNQSEEGTLRRSGLARLSLAAPDLHYTITITNPLPLFRIEIEPVGLTSRR